MHYGYENDPYAAQRMLTTYDANRGWGDLGDAAAASAAIQGITQLIGAGIQTGGAIAAGQQQQRLLQEQQELAAQQTQLQQILAAEETQRAITIAKYAAGTLVILGLAGAALYYYTQR